MMRKLVVVPARPAGDPNDYRATFGIGIGAAQTIGTQLTPLFVVRRAGTLYDIVAESGRPGTGTIYLDILRSRDWGATWTSILTTTSPSPLALTAGAVVPHVRVTNFNASANEVQIDDLLRIDLLADSSEDWQDVETVLQWLP